jgi:hypothetical protein
MTLFLRMKPTQTAPDFPQVADLQTLIYLSVLNGEHSSLESIEQNYSAR